MAGKQVQIYSPLNNLVHPETEASVVLIDDIGDYYTSAYVEGALQEIGLALENVGGSDAVDIAITDVGEYYDATNVETALQEIAGDVSTINSLFVSYQLKSEKGQANGYASLGMDGLVPNTQLPSYVDDVLEYATLLGFPAIGETGKIYVALDTNKTYRWSGSTYVYITSGAVDSVAGKTGVVTLVKADVGLSNVDNTADNVKSVSKAATLTTPRTLTIGSTGKNFDGSANVSWSLAEIGAQAAGSYAAASHTHGNITNAGAIGSTAGLMVKTTTSGVLTTLAAGTTGQFLRGDGTWANLDFAKKASNEGVAADGQVLTANGDGTFTYETPIATNAMVEYTEEFTATEGQTTFVLTMGTYTPGANRLTVYIWGIRQYSTAFTETSTSSFTLAAGVPAGTKVIANWRVADATLKGDTGTAATVAVGTTTTGVAGTNASVTNSGTSSAAVFNFTIPRGDTGATGAAATIAIGTVTTLAPGSAATITNVGTSGAAIFNFGIPQGAAGASAANAVTVADTGAYYTGTNVEAVLQEIANHLAVKAPLVSPNFSGYPTINGNLIVTSTNGTIDYYVSPTGSDSNNGSSGSPFLTIGYAISQIPKILRHLVTINVAPGTYAENIIIDGFTGVQKISLIGGANSTEALNYIVNRIILENNTVEVYVKGFKSISTSWHSFDVGNCTKFSFYSCVTTDVTTVYNGFNISSSNGYIYDCVADSKKYALKSYSNSNVFSYSWDSGSTGNEVGLYASEGGTIYNSGTQPSGTTNTAVAFGGVITGAVINPAPLSSPTFTGTVVLPSTTSIGSVSSTEIGYLDGVTSAVQTQLNDKAPLASPTFTGTVSGITAAMVGALPLTGGTISGNLIVTGTITESSDRSLKTNIEPLQNSLEKVLSLRGVSFDKNGERNIGLIAQDVKLIIPEVVKEGEYLSIAYGNLVGLLIEAIKDLNNEVQELRGIING